jgi:hypothetical protein
MRTTPGTITEHTIAKKQTHSPLVLYYCRRRQAHSIGTPAGSNVTTIAVLLCIILTTNVMLIIEM